MSFLTYQFDLDHRLLSHARPRDAPMNGPAEGRAAVTKDGYCVEFRESLD